MPKADICMLCDCSPCECSKKKSPRPRTKKEPPAETPVAQARPSALEAMRQASLRPQTAPPAPVRPTYVQQDDGEKELIKAVHVVTTLLGGQFVDPADEVQLRAALREGPDPQLRTYLWRTRREASHGTGGGDTGDVGRDAD